MNARKKRSLEKYIDKKLKREERSTLLSKIAQSQASCNPTKLQSSASLGSRKSTTTLRENLDTGSTDLIIARQLGADQKWNDSQSSNPQEGLSSGSFDGLDSECDSETEQWGSEGEVEWAGFSDHGDDVRSRICRQNDHGEVDNGEKEHPKRKRRRTAAGFKDWALQQVNAAKSHPAGPAPQPFLLPNSIASNLRTSPHTSAVQDSIRGPLGEEFTLPSNSFADHVRNQGLASHGSLQVSFKIDVKVHREESVQVARLLLPVVAEEQPIMEAVLLNAAVIICGETGSGKTTQIPQFLYEAGFGNSTSDNPGMIGVTQPRRVAAMSMAARVAYELSLPSSHVSYQIRYDATISPMTKIKFMTDGILLRELTTDILLSRYSVIVVDEAHERSMNTDILIGVVSRTVKLREKLWKEGKEGIKPLRLIIMSATLRISDFTSNPVLFPVPPPIIDIPLRRHPVTIHFSRRTVPDYAAETVRKIMKIHVRLPPGGILVFLTGENEIMDVCRKLEARFGRAAIRENTTRRKGRIPRATSNGEAWEGKETDQWTIAIPTQVDVEAEEVYLGSGSRNDLAGDVDNDADVKTSMEALDSDPEGSDGDLATIDPDDTDVPMHVLPLYSLLSSEKQMQVFQTPPRDARLVVVATNVAETSLTIPGIRYVVDSGRVKERKYNLQSGIQSYQVTWISKASAAQRAGRAGRTGPGHCYRLYSSAVFENYFDDFTQPEILRVPIEGVVLQMKSMNIDTVVNFPFPTAPDRASLQRAETLLRHLGALGDEAGGSQITSLGRTMAIFPVSPRFSKMLASARPHGCLPLVVAIVSALSVGDPFLHEEALKDIDSASGDEDTGLLDPTPDLSQPHNTGVQRKEATKGRRRAFFLARQTHGSLGNFTSDVFRLLSVVGAYEFAGGAQKFCTEQFVRPKAMEEIQRLRLQISQIMQANFPDMAEEFSQKMHPPNKTQLKILRQLLAAGFIDQVAIRKDLAEKSNSSGFTYTSSRDVPYKALGISEDVFIHPSSVLCHVTPPEYVVFHEIIHTSRPWMKTVTVINPSWLPKLGPTLCSISKPLKSPGGHALVIPRFGPSLWELPAMKRLVEH